MPHCLMCLVAHAVVCFMTCARSACDDVVAVAKLCAAAGIPHMINNAYGVQSRAICDHITSAWRKGEACSYLERVAVRNSCVCFLHSEGVLWVHSACAGRVDCVVQSTDKNFMVPVGGAIVSNRGGLGRVHMYDTLEMQISALRHPCLAATSMRSKALLNTSSSCISHSALFGT
jgi:glutamate/tyrosine decarboxylase-like PLP-dependent enzyme